MAEGGGLLNHIEASRLLHIHARQPHDYDMKPCFQGFCEYVVITHSFALLVLHSVARKRLCRVLISSD